MVPCIQKFIINGNAPKRQKAKIACHTVVHMSVLIDSCIIFAFLLQNSIRHTLCVRQKFVRLPRVTNGSVSRKSWWTINDDFLQKRSDAGAKASLPATNEKYANKETQTEQFVCGVCSFAHAVPRSR